MANYILRHKILSLLIFGGIAYLFPYYIFLPKYIENPFLYNAKKDMESILTAERVRVYAYSIDELEELYKLKFGDKLVYDKDGSRLSDPTLGGEPFWECIKKGKLYTSIKPGKALLTYRHTNEIATCELTVARIRSGYGWTDRIEHIFRLCFDTRYGWTERRVGTLYFDKRLYIPIGMLSDHSCVNRLDECYPFNFIPFEDLKKRNTNDSLTHSTSPEVEFKIGETIL